ncbi:hypothetical protein G6F46_014626 [Rhizopus delemar]|nr:hypothetical protein G6F46_014626 [Rhizopus delemar]
MTVNPAIYNNLDYDPVADFAPISLVGDIPMILTVKADSSARSVADLVGQGKKNGKPLFAGSGANSFQLATALFAKRRGRGVVGQRDRLRADRHGSRTAPDPQRPAEGAGWHRREAFYLIA